VGEKDAYNGVWGGILRVYGYSMEINIMLEYNGEDWRLDLGQGKPKSVRNVGFAFRYHELTYKGPYNLSEGSYSTASLPKSKSMSQQNGGGNFALPYLICMGTKYQVSSPLHVLASFCLSFSVPAKVFFFWMSFMRTLHLSPIKRCKTQPSSKAVMTDQTTKPFTANNTSSACVAASAPNIMKHIMKRS
jgi:hypothetical protein